MPRVVNRGRAAHESLNEAADDDMREERGGEDPAASPESDQSGEDDDANADADDSGESQLVTKLVRYALACEYARTPIRKEGIKEKVLGPHSRSFRKVLAGAQSQLRSVFGMELVELPTRDRATMTVEEKRKSSKTQSQGAPASNSYMLVSRLPEAYRSAAIIAPARIQSQTEEAQYVGLYSTIVSIITLSGGELSDAKLQRHLARLNAKDNMPMDKTENVLLRMIKQGYLIRVKNKGVAGDDDSVTWYVGPRGRVELGPEAIAGFVREVYGASSDDLEKRLQASLKVRPRETAMVNVNGQEDGEQANGEGYSRPARGRRRAAEEDEEQDEEE